MNYPIEVSEKGTVSLGPDVCCDGFLHGVHSRVQTHVHLDHMDRFETSKGLQDIVTSEATKELLICELNADLPYRSNIKGLRESEWRNAADSRISLLQSGHMLGAVQVLVETSQGDRLGYSGDFRWPLDHVIEVEALVVDSTCGSPRNVRQFTQGECEELFISVVRRSLANGSVYIRAHRGTIERALELISSETGAPVIASPRLCRTAEIYRRHGYTIDELLDTESAQGKEIAAEQNVIQIHTTGDGEPYQRARGTYINLSAYAVHFEEPARWHSEKAVSIAFSNHADFKGTLEYVEATGAKFVVTDNTRGGKGIVLAEEIKRRLGIEARPSTSVESRTWGS